MHDIAIDGKDVIVDGERFTFDHEIGDILNVGDVIVVRLKIPPNIVNNRNILAIDFDGHDIWKIPESPKTSFEDDPYMSLYQEDGGLWARTWSDWAYRIDPDNGEIIRSDNVR